jgi:hypothetical protein
MDCRAREKRRLILLNRVLHDKLIAAQLVNKSVRFTEAGGSVLLTRTPFLSKPDKTKHILVPFDKMNFKINHRSVPWSR